MRGPYGNGFDIDIYKNREVIVAAGGTLTMDKTEDGYTGNVELITGFVKDIPIEDIEGAQVVIVGPPVMFKFTAAEFLKRGIKEENIWVSYERKMCCGV